jgi:integrase/recombinase XerC
MQGDGDRLRSRLGVYTDEDAELALARVFGAGVRPLRLEAAVFEAMLGGWRAQQLARFFKPKTIRGNLQAARAFHAHADAWPWEWRPEHADEYFSDLLCRGLRPATVRGYQLRLKGLSVYLTDPRYPWLAICRREFGSVPVQLFDDHNVVAHLSGFEGDPRRRPLTLEELETFFACADERIARRCRLRRKGELTAWRDQALFKVMFGWGLRRRETARLDIVDVRPHAALPEFRGCGALHVRYGKAMRGGSPRRRTVLSVFDWAVDTLEQYLAEVRPCFGAEQHPALFVTERGTRISCSYVTERFAELRRDAGLPEELTPHCLRHSYVTHLAELGFAQRFIQDQVGHSHAATTAIYLSVSDEFKDRMVRRALDAQLASTRGGA